ncbi:MAG: hypothetical protein K5917_07045 [Clostridiales bacterium]|nr:hypothetical protein [Clostridiales bacterium]
MEEMKDTKGFKTLLEEDKELYQMIINSIYKLYTNDEYLINNSPDNDKDPDSLHHLGERSIVFRYA